MLAFFTCGVWLAAFISNEIYFIRIVLVLIGTVTIGFGISLAVMANIIMNSGEAFVKAVADKTQLEFGNVKIGFDVTCVTVSIILSLIFFAGQIKGTREGTIIAAFCTGLAVKFFQNKLEKVLNSKS